MNSVPQKGFDWRINQKLVVIQTANGQSTWVQHCTPEVSHVRVSTSGVGVTATGYREINDVTLEFVRRDFILFKDEGDLRDIHDGFAWDVDKVQSFVEAIFPQDDVVAA